MRMASLLKGLCGVALALLSLAWISPNPAQAATTVDMLWDASYTATSDATATALEFPPILIANDGTHTVLSDIRFIIPSTYQMAWDSSDTSVEILVSSAAGTISSTVSSFLASGNGRVVQLNLTSNTWVTCDRFLVTGLGTRTWTSDCTSATVGISWDLDSTANASSNQTFTNWRGSFASANNFSFKVGDPTPTLPSVTVTESTSGPTIITQANAFTLVIPAVAAYGTSPTWDTSLTIGSLTFSGSASGRVNTSTALTGAGTRALTIPLLTSFLNGETLTITGLRFGTITAAYTADSLELSVDAGTTVSALDKRLFAISPPSISVNAMPTTSVSASGEELRTTTAADNVTVTLTDVNGGAFTVNSDIRLVILGNANVGNNANGRDNLTWVSPIAVTLTVGGSGSGNVSTTLLGSADRGNTSAAASSGGRTLSISVTTAFSATQDLTITDGLRLSNSLAIATQVYLGLVKSSFGSGHSRTAAFGYIVSITTPQNLTGGGAGTTGSTTGTGGGGVCFLRTAGRQSAK